MDSAVAAGAERAVGIQELDEPGFSHWAIRSNEGWEGIGCAFEIVDQGLWIGPDEWVDGSARTRPANVRLRMTTRTLIRIESWSEAIVGSSANAIDLSEPCLPVRKEVKSTWRLREVGEWLAGIDSIGAHTRVMCTFRCKWRSLTLGSHNLNHGWREQREKQGRDD